MGIVSRFFGWVYDEPTAPGDRESYSRAALDVIADNFRLGSVWPGDHKDTIDAMDLKLSKAREWANSVTDGRARRAYLGWIDFYQKRADAARDDLTTHAYQKRMDRIYAKEDARAESADRIKETLPQPQPHC